MTECCGGRGDPRPESPAPKGRPEGSESRSSRPLTGSRLRRALVLFASAAALAWLGPEWRVSSFLVALGTGLLYALFAAALFSRAQAGALPWACAPLLLLPAALLLGAAWLPRVTSGGNPVVVEVFLSGGAGSGDESLEAALDALPSGTIAVAWDLRRETGRGRLGALAGLDAALSPEAAGEIVDPVWFVNGLPSSRLESLADAVRRESMQDDRPRARVRSTRIPDYAGNIPTEAALELSAPEGARCRLLLLREKAVAGSFVVWEGLRALGPSAETGPGEESAEGIRHLTFWVPAFRASDSAATCLLFLVSQGGRILLAEALDSADSP